MPKPDKLTASEKLLINILEKHGITPYRIPPSQNKGEESPDFEISIGSTSTIWEVKEITENSFEKSIEGEEYEESYSIESRKRLNKRVDKAVKQLSSFKAENKPCIIAIMDNRSFFTKDLILHDEIMLILAGRGHFSTDRDGQRHEIHRDKSRISGYGFIRAIALIYKETEEVVIFHNPNATFPLTSPSFSAIFKNNYRLEKTERSLVWIKDLSSQIE
ncbi:MAG: hypothetical protein REI12_11240 [Pedobacter sp.]|nr:hypothetical protein [Pedobacter sp.]